MTEPSWRKPVGALLILALVLLWVMLFASFSATVATLHWSLQLVYYLTAGLAWIWLTPVKPILRWMQTNHWR
ncbi:MAG TPA: DUF2842 domain-containing protein [Sphingomonas sp.]|jgi:hypothetical protein|uniref:DUF2842 domain-containing protein n=1 Tax=Sphingomonas sp. TaxID=28214 RepID=UPI002ED95E55